MSGVPRGSVLGPIQFLIYVNGLQALLPGDELSFTDDVNLIFARTSLNDLKQDVEFTWDKDLC